MEVQKLFLKQNLNIDEFSKRINLPVKEVSAVINKHYGTNFFEFMNSYRVEEAKRLHCCTIPGCKSAVKAIMGSKCCRDLG